MPISMNPIQSDIAEGFATSQVYEWQSNRDRLGVARKSLDYYNGDYLPHRIQLWQENPDLYRIPWRSVSLMTQVVDHLAAHLYRHDPLRTFPEDEEATDFLQKVYASNRMHAKWQFADKLTVVSQVAAFQVAGTADPENPIKINLWDASQFVVYPDEDDPCKVGAVVTIDRTESGTRKRYQVWTDETYQVYVGEKAFIPGGVRQLTMIQDDANPYGTIPFAFAFFHTPVLSFWNGSPGAHLTEANEYLNYRLTDLALDIGQLKPVGIAKNVAPEWSPRGKYRVGQFYLLPGENDAAGNPLGDPDLTYAEPSLAYVEGIWTDIAKYIGTTLEGAGVPESAVRMAQTSARSGVSVIAEQAPLLTWALSRQPAFLEYESDLAKVVLKVAVSHMRNNGVVRPALEQALADFHFHVRWSPVEPPVLPGPERDDRDLFAIQNGFKSRLMVLQERYSLSRDEALSFLEQIAEDQEAEAALKTQEASEVPADEAKEEGDLETEDQQGDAADDQQEVGDVEGQESEANKA